jgi:GT2 family glycosyltransferase
MVLERARALIIAVHYKTDDGVLALFDSLQRLNEYGSLRMLIADSGSGEESLARIRSMANDHTSVELVECGVNRGYFGAARFAIDHYLAAGHALPDWVIVCNHDVLIEDKDFFSKLFREDPEVVGVIAPRIQTLPGKLDQNPFLRHRPGWWHWAQVRLISCNYVVAAIWDWLSRRMAELRSWLASRRGEAHPSDTAWRESIYAPHGSFFIFSRRYFDAGGFLDGNLFLYFEEISVAEICRSLDLTVTYDPSLCVLHNEHQSTGQGLSRFSYDCHRRAFRYISSRYFLGLRLR